MQMNAFSQRAFLPLQKHDHARNRHEGIDKAAQSVPVKPGENPLAQLTAEQDGKDANRP